MYHTVPSGVASIAQVQIKTLQLSIKVRKAPRLEPFPFQIGNAYTLAASGNSVFNNLGANLGGALGSSFDWGLPFFLGRKVYVGIEGTPSILGTGPYWAY